MNASPRIKDLQSEDPLYASLKKVEKNPQAARAGSKSRPMGRIALLVLGLAAVTYYLLQTRETMDQLESRLAESQGHLTQVTARLEDSGKKIGELEAGLTGSRTQLARQERDLNRYKGLYQEVKSHQDQQSAELQVISTAKADRGQVEQIENETSRIKENLETVNSRLSTADSAISDVREAASRNRADIESTRTVLDRVGQTASENSGQISELKRSLEREYYNFELQEKGGIMKVFNVALSLKDADQRRQRYDLDIVVGTKRIRKNDQSINEPIYFYPEGVKKPYEVVVTKVDKKYVVGYLSIPKG